METCGHQNFIFKNLVTISYEEGSNTSGYFSIFN
jgi:hypothetical protein